MKSQHDPGFSDSETPPAPRRSWFMRHRRKLIDDISSVIGTANFDNRSMRLNFEVSMLLVGKDSPPAIGNIQKGKQIPTAANRVDMTT